MSVLTLLPRTVSGKPTRRLVEKVLPEFVGIAFGMKERQSNSTHEPLDMSAMRAIGFSRLD